MMRVRPRGRNLTAVQTRRPSKIVPARFFILLYTTNSISSHIWAKKADVKDDSKLSVATNITGIMIFAVAVIGVFWLWFDAFAKTQKELEGVSKSRDS